jgi:hypothetical protein
MPDRNPTGIELRLSSAPRQGSWGDPKAGERWEKDRRNIGVALSRREERGPMRCALRVCSGAAARDKPELEVQLKNCSEYSVALYIHRLLLDLVTFILRDPDGNVESSFCYMTTHSNFEPLPPVILKPGESKASSIFLSVASDHGFRPLRPGLYSLEAVFHEHGFLDPLGPDHSMFARSNRLLVRVGDF